MFEYYHNLNPFLIEFIPGIGIRYYSLAYAFGAVLAYFIGVYLIRTGRMKLEEKKLMDVVFYLMFFGIVLGGRLGYCLFYNPISFISFDSSFPFWEVLKIHEGGMSSHGGVIGVLVCAYIYGYKNKVDFFSLADFLALGTTIGVFFGRFANFINGELYGRVIEGKYLLGVRFPTEISEWLAHPKVYKEQLLSLKAVLPSLKELSSRRIPNVSDWEGWVEKVAEGSRFYEGYLYNVGYEVMKFSGENSIKEILEPLLFLRHPSQIYQAFLGGGLSFLISIIFWRKKRSTGRVALLTMGTYFSFRFITEFFRQPDTHIGFQMLGLTRGQWLSGLLILGMLFYAYLLYRKEKGLS